MDAAAIAFASPNAVDLVFKAVENFPAALIDIRHEQFVFDE
jgi:hypothetical protein